MSITQSSNRWKRFFFYFSWTPFSYFMFIENVILRWSKTTQCRSSANIQSKISLKETKSIPPSMMLGTEYREYGYLCQKESYLKFNRVHYLPLSIQRKPLKLLHGSGKCSTEQPPRWLTFILSAVKTWLQSYCDTICSTDAVNQMFKQNITICTYIQGPSQYWITLKHTVSIFYPTI